MFFRAVNVDFSAPSMQPNEPSCLWLFWSIIPLTLSVLSYFGLWLLVVMIAHPDPRLDIPSRIGIGILAIVAFVSSIGFTAASCIVFVQQIINFRRAASTSCPQNNVAPSPNP